MKSSEEGNMPESILDKEVYLRMDSAGLFMSPEKFDSIEIYDECYRRNVCSTFCRWVSGRVCV